MSKLTRDTWISANDFLHTPGFLRAVARSRFELFLYWHEPKDKKSVILRNEFTLQQYNCYMVCFFISEWGRG